MQLPSIGVKKKKKHSTTVTGASSNDMEQYIKTKEGVRANLKAISELLDETLEALRKPQHPKKE